MTKLLTCAIGLLAGAALSLSAYGQSQCGALPIGVVAVNNTGCPNYVTPCFSGTPRIGQTVQINWQVRPAPRSMGFVLLGFPSGGGITFQPPVACVPGGCRLYAAPLGSSFLVATDPFNPTLTLPIPNDPQLLQQSFAVQGGFLSGLGGCFDLSQAATFVALR